MAYKEPGFIRQGLYIIGWKIKEFFRKKPSRFDLMCEIASNRRDYEKISAVNEALQELLAEERDKTRDLRKANETLSSAVKVGDPVFVRANCESVCVEVDRDTGAILCPFENVCELECCENNAEMQIFQTTIESAYDNGHGTKLALKNVWGEFDIAADFGKLVFLTRKEAEAKNEE